MEENENVKIAKHCLRYMAGEDVCEECPAYGGSDLMCREAARYALSILEEAQRYRVIGSVEECQTAVEKQKDKETINPETPLERYYHEPQCPNCKRELIPKICGYTLAQAIGSYSYCPWCGQKIKG